ncbi:hypothetical protein NW768_010207 [Fusarium equiseti]|uniref:Serine threonine protein kinase n=1 Tax=Fusarium equiseti TaxID=61235 RepID=A0ABQ8R135_FUSEQ|nr:hypothetical protein NW768_010207 [Fusarium equiseti]
MVQLVTVALHHRDHFSVGNARRVFDKQAYHWSIMIIPSPGEAENVHSFDATDASHINPVTFRMNNPTMDWWFRSELDITPQRHEKLLGRIVIGEIPEDVSGEELGEFFQGIPLPVKNTDPQQSSVTWINDAIRALQEKGWAMEFDLDLFKAFAVSYADERMKGAEAEDPELKYFES